MKIDPKAPASSASIRTVAAIAAMQGLLANQQLGQSNTAWLAREAVENADALIAELNKEVEE